MALTPPHAQGIEQQNNKIHTLDMQKILLFPSYIIKLVQNVQTISRNDKHLLYGDKFSPFLNTQEFLLRALLFRNGGDRSVPIHCRLAPLGVTKQILQHGMLVDVEQPFMGKILSDGRVGWKSMSSFTRWQSRHAAT
jgi:hypothetical protein